MLTVVAIRPFEHQGRSIHHGEAVELTVAETVAYARRGYISLDRERRPTYERRDMVAADLQPVVVLPDIQAVVDVLDPAPKRRRGRPRKQPV